MKRSDPNSFLHNQIYLYRELIYYTQQIGKFLAAAQSLASTCTNMLKKNLGFLRKFCQIGRKGLGKNFIKSSQSTLNISKQEAIFPVIEHNKAVTIKLSEKSHRNILDLTFSGMQKAKILYQQF